MQPLTIRRRISQYGDVKVVIATDIEQRTFMGVPVGDGDGGDTHLFIEIDRVTLLELERGAVELYTVLTERGIGLAFETSDYELDPTNVLSASPTWCGTAVILQPGDA